MSLLFYKSIQPLNSEKHRLLYQELFADDFGFARTTPAAPLAATEFFAACRHFPILFSGDDAGLLAVAIMGYSEKQNLFINDQNQWQNNTYIPAFVRRYPFILAQDNDASRQTLCFDDSWKGFNQEQRGVPLFTEQGEQTEHLKKVLAFVEALHQDMQRTQPFINRLLELKLLVQRDLQVRVPGNNILLKDFRVIDEAAFMKLDDATVLEFHHKGWLPWVYAHLLSLSNLGQLPG